MAVFEMFFHGTGLKHRGERLKRQFFVFVFLFSAAAFRTEGAGCLISYDREIIATCMVLEAGGEGTDGMRAVLNVIVNRAKGDLNRMVPVTLKYGAFSCMASVWNTDDLDCTRLLSRAQDQIEPFTDAMNLIATLEQGLLLDNTGGATHYHADYVTPYWAGSMRYLTTIGGHHFYVETGRQVAAL